MQQLLYCQQVSTTLPRSAWAFCHVTTAVEQLKLVGSYVECITHVETGWREELSNRLYHYTSYNHANFMAPPSKHTHTHTLWSMSHPLASGCQCGAKRPENAGTKYTPPVSFSISAYFSEKKYSHDNTCTCRSWYLKYTIWYGWPPNGPEKLMWLYLCICIIYTL